MEFSLQKSPKRFLFATYLCCATFLVSFFAFKPLTLFAYTSVSADIVSDTAWTLSQSPYVVQSRIDVLEGANLTVEPGVVIKFVDGGAINVYGGMRAEGTPTSKIYFTSFENDSILGDTNGDGDDSQPYPSWSINFSTGVAPVFSNIDLSYSEGLALLNSNNGVFSDIKVSESSDGFYVNNGTLTLERSGFLNMEDSVVTGFSSVVKMHDSIVENTFGRNAVFLLFDRSEGEIIYTQIKNTGFDTPIIIFESDLLVEDSVLEDGLDSGILVFGRSSPLSPGNLILKNTQVKNFALSGITSFNNTHLDIQNSLISGNEVGIELFDSSGPNFATAEVRGSSIVDNVYGGIERRERPGYVPSMTNNWWGDVSGPLHLNNPEGLGQEIVGNVQFTPWLTEDPFVTEPPPPECCSSVAFIPGFQASRLYKQGTFFENKLWEPNRNADAQKLFLDEGGVPIESGIYTRDVVDEGFGFNIYKTFIEFMDSLVSDETIAEWQDMPYDWRLKISDIVQKPVQLENGTYRIVDEVIALAERSDTGKVSLIGHSNGGLVAKEIVRELERRGKDNLVDKLILVAVPQLGTPKAIAAILHGDEQDLAGGFLLSKTVARGLGEYMFGAYSLLPSRKYFEEVSDPVIVFDPSVSNINSHLLNYGNSVTSFDSLKNFMIAGEGDRTKPLSFDSLTPNVLKPLFIDSGDEIHNELDNWIPPVDLEMIEIAGWGLDTIKGIEYRAEEVCGNPSGDFCLDKTYVFDRRPLFTTDGDGTVVTPSAITNDATNFFIDLESENRGVNINRKHADILETNSTRLFIGDLIKESVGVLPDYVSGTQPPNNDTSERIRLSVHSPVSLDIYDSFGNHTGIVPDPDTDLVRTEENIPNSYYMEFGEGKYVGFEETNQNTRVNLQGTGYGTFTVEIEKVEGDAIVNRFVFNDLLVTPLMSGEIIVGTTSDPILELDVDGDGDFDFNLSSQEGFDPILYLKMIKQIIPTLGLKRNVEKQLLQKADRAIQLIEKGKFQKAGEKIKKYIKQIDRKKQKKLADDDRQVLINMFTNLLNNLN